MFSKKETSTDIASVFWKRYLNRWGGVIVLALVLAFLAWTSLNTFVDPQLDEFEKSVLGHLGGLIAVGLLIVIALLLVFARLGDILDRLRWWDKNSPK